MRSTRRPEGEVLIASSAGEKAPLIADEPSNSTFTPGKRRRMNLEAICLNLFLPWMLFVGLYLAVGFSFHYEHPVGVWVAVGFGCAVVVVAALLALNTRSRARDATWHLFATIMFALAVFFAVVFGNMNFHLNMSGYYDVENLNTYPSVDPSREKGQQLMDAGRVYFAEGTTLDIDKAMGFKNVDIYCVAPIVMGDAQLPSYDFWAVGVNCCSGISADFRCGEFNNPHARAGLRLMHADQRPYFRLAVQQSEAAYSIKAIHPLFFYWMQDPVEEANAYRDSGYKYFLLGVFSFFAFNAFCVAIAIVAFSRIGCT